MDDVGVGTLSIQVTSNPDNGKYNDYYVVARAPLGNSAGSTAVRLTTEWAALLAPANVKVNNVTSATVAPSSSTTIKWDTVANKTNNPVTGYEVHSSSSSTIGFTRLASIAAGTTTYTFNAPSSEATVYYKVMAKGSEADGPLSSTVSLIVSLATAEAATFTLSPSSIEAGQTLTITTTSNNEKIKRVIITFGAVDSGIITMASNVTSATFDIPMDWCLQMPNDTSLTARVSVSTYVGTTLVGRIISNLTISVPISVKPTLSSVSGERVDNNVPPSWGVYVVSQSMVDISMGTGSTAYGSPIASYKITGGGLDVSSSLPFNQRSPALQSTTTYFKIRITDTRGRYTEYPLTVSAYAYAAPTLETESIRCNSNGDFEAEGTYGSAWAKSTFSSVDSKNAITITAKYRQKGSAGVYTDIGTLTNNAPTGKVFGGALNLNYYYDVLYEVVDTIGTKTQYIDDISSAEYILNFKNNGRGMGIGGPAGADGKLVLHWNIKSETTDLAVGLNADYIDGKHASDFVPTSRKINGQALTEDITISVVSTPEDIGAMSNASTIIPASSNLNAYTTIGFYYCPANATVTTLTNCPTSSAFSLFVEKHTGTKQTLTEYLTNASSRTFFRNFDNSTWGDWKQYLDSKTFSDFAA